MSEFRDDILALYNDNAFYDFELGVTYYLHGFDDCGRVFTRISFRLVSLDDKEEILGDCFDSFLNDINKYLKKNSYDNTANRMLVGIYISTYSVNTVEHKILKNLLKDKLNTLHKIRNDLLLPISLITKN